ncbi:tumor necrosis factor receptor superfamily member 14-like isoform X2 [Silurus meridionalis]|nr:tumor necrosis factor receptor superfamily member 14-like isoform X2 [Silurus meridionalis]
MKSTFLTLLFYIISFTTCKTFGASCRHGEYLSTAGECCPMCNIGLVVLRDCIGDYSTTCSPCIKGTFMNVPNGVHTCFPCKTCDRGLYTLQNCSTIKDKVCEVLDGYYCAQYSDRECSLAMKHSECKPGEQIKTLGTKSVNTVCELCPSGFYSPEGVKCTKWTDCSLSNEIVDEEGTPIRDVKCKPTRNRFLLIAALLASAVLLLSLLILYWKHRNIRQPGVPVEETNPATSK